MSFVLPGLSRETFLAEHWRKRPLVLRGAGATLLSPALEEQEFLASIRQLEAQDAGLVRRSGDSVIFGQRIDLANERLRQVRERFAADLWCPSVWLDGVLARDGQSIGCHYDDSDNFVIQQHGVKHWRLHHPGIIPQEELRQRMLHNPKVGSMYLPEATFECVLEPGDVLYIPLFWAHWGISEGPSLSMSAVCNTENALDVLLPALAAELSTDPDWWAPMPSVDLLEPAGAPAEAAAEAQAHMERLLKRLMSPELLGQVRQRFARTRQHRVRGMSGAVPAPASTPADEHVTLDMDRIRAVLTAPLPRLDPARLVLPSRDGAEVALLRSLAARVHLKRFFVICSKGAPLLASSALRRTFQDGLQAFQHLDVGTMERLILRPELTSWSTHAQQALDFDYGPRFEAIAEHLGAFLLPELLTRRPQPATLDGSLALLDDHPWYREFFPKHERTRQHPLMLGAAPAEFAHFQACMSQGAELLAAVWPEAWSVLRSHTVLLAALKPEAPEPPVAATSAFRGLLALHPEPAHLTARALIRAAATDRFHALLDVFKLSSRADKERHPSAWTGEPQPFPALFREVFAHLQELHLMRRLQGHVPEEAGRALRQEQATAETRLSTSLELLRTQGQPTEHGERLLGAMREALGS